MKVGFKWIIRLTTKWASLTWSVQTRFFIEFFQNRNQKFSLKFGRWDEDIAIMYSNIQILLLFGYFISKKKKKKKSKTMNLSPSKSMQDQVSIVWPFLSLSLSSFISFISFPLNRMNNIALSAFQRVPRRNAEKHYHEFSVQSISLWNYNAVRPIISEMNENLNSIK